MTKAFSYLRVSSKIQISGDGFPRQREAVQQYAASHNIVIEHEFRDEGVTGTADALDRPGLTDLFIAVKSNGVRLVLVERADRLARDLMVSEIILAECRKLGVKVVAADSGTDLTVEDNEPTRTLIRQILGAVAQWEKSCLVMKLRAARNRIRRSGQRCEGAKPFGRNDTERAVIAEIQQLRDEGVSYDLIAGHLNAAAVPPRRGKRWHATQVRRVLLQAASGQ